MYVVHLPDINIVVGTTLLLTGVFGVFHRYGKFNGGKDDGRYQMPFSYVDEHALHASHYSSGIRV